MELRCGVVFGGESGSVGGEGAGLIDAGRFGVKVA